ncbi:MAG TPA: sigma-70 family RNA polymerase sigma factor [Micromonosporaceae bacterium]|nr:sigma-70 family RNA polymerase sigma factor [Micromonosporaceae bacterium]
MRGASAVTRVGSGHDPVDLAAAVAAAREGDEDAFRVLYREVQPGLLRYLRGLVGEDADDVASEAWLQIARDIRTFRDQGAGFRGWAARVARNRALDHLRRHRCRPVTLVPAELLADVADRYDVADEAVTAAATRSAIALVATLPRDQAEAILLRTVMGLDAIAAARVLGKRPGSVRTAAWRGLRRLAALLEAPSVDRTGQTGQTGPTRPGSGPRADDMTCRSRVTKSARPTPEEVR